MTTTTAPKRTAQRKPRTAKAAGVTTPDLADAMMEETFDAIDPKRTLQDYAVAYEAQKMIPLENAGLDILAHRVTEAIKGLVIADDDTEKFAIETGVLAKTIADRIESERKTRVEPLNKQVKDVNAEFKTMGAPFETIKDLARKAVMAYRDLKAAAARAEAERVQKILDDQRRAQIEAAKAAGRAVTGTGLTIPVAEQANTTHSDTGKAVGTKRWTATIIDTKQIPAEFMIPDMTKINAAVRAGVREIPGVEIKQVENVSFRW